MRQIAGVGQPVGRAFGGSVAVDRIGIRYHAMFSQKTAAFLAGEAITTALLSMI
jgi:hypothetical protein